MLRFINQANDVGPSTNIPAKSPTSELWPDEPDELLVYDDEAEGDPDTEGDNNNNDNDADLYTEDGEEEAHGENEVDDALPINTEPEEVLERQAEEDDMYADDGNDDGDADENTDSKTAIQSTSPINETTNKTVTTRQSASSLNSKRTFVDDDEDAEGIAVNGRKCKSSFFRTA